ncbi:hypothetical protein JHD50_07985 [Sulfurimonas sp. MAG313]|nr:hypothetical protein [Sulfurimonas sp. MAG313]MDF1881240.1 hypothetical protein [Sulfurimonas sp. MAG313]
MKTLILMSLMALSLFGEKTIEHKHKHSHADCAKPIIFDETPLEKIFELKGKVYKVLKGDETNPSLLYVMDPKTNKFIQIKQK